MPAMYETAYPRLKPTPTTRELREIYTPTFAERQLAEAVTSGKSAHVAFLCLLKTYQRLGYPVPLTTIPSAVVDHIADHVQCRITTADLVRYDASGTRRRHLKRIRDHLGLHAYDASVQQALEAAMLAATQTKDDLVDLINIAIEELVRQRCELPAFSTFERTAARIRREANHTLYEHVLQAAATLQVSGESYKEPTSVASAASSPGRTPERTLQDTVHLRAPHDTVPQAMVTEPATTPIGLLRQLDALLIPDPASRTSPWDRLREEPGRATITQVKTHLAHIAWLKWLQMGTAALQNIPEVKVKRFASEACALDAGRMRQTHARKRYTLILSLLVTRYAQALDDLADMIIKRLLKLHQQGKAAFDAYRQQQENQINTLIAVLRDVTQAYQGAGTTQERFTAIDTALGGRSAEVFAACEQHLAFVANTYYPFIAAYYDRHRALFFKFLHAVTLRSAHQDIALETTITFLLANEHRTGAWLTVGSVRPPNRRAKAIQPTPMRSPIHHLPTPSAERPLAERKDASKGATDVWQSAPQTLRTFHGDPSPQQVPDQRPGIPGDKLIALQRMAFPLNLSHLVSSLALNDVADVASTAKEHSAESANPAEPSEKPAAPAEERLHPGVLDDPPTPQDGAIEPLVDLSWMSAVWWRLVAGQRKRMPFPLRVKRRLFEIAVFSQILWNLKTGDLCIEGSDLYANTWAQGISWERYNATVGDYGKMLNFPVEGSEFVAHLRTWLEQTAREADAAFPKGQVTLHDGDLIIHRLATIAPPAGVTDLEQELAARLEPVGLLDMLSDVQFWLQWCQVFGPISGFETKLEDAVERYLMTVFAYGTQLGPSQAARSLPDIDRRQLAWIHHHHVTVEALEKANTLIINAYARFALPKRWGTGKRASADGTKWDIHVQNLLAEYHIRYGGYGGVGYYHVSDTYIALFSHFIPCGVWEAVYILDGLLKNTSDLQPEEIAGDTQAQNAVVFGVAYLLGIRLMPRIRNLRDLTLYRPTPDTTYTHINTLLTEPVDWDLIATHLPDMLRIILSIKEGVMMASTILRKLSVYSHRNKLYQAFRELGRVVRTVFILQYLVDPDLRATIQAATNKSESFNQLVQWLAFGNGGVIPTNNREEMRKYIKYNQLLANCVIFANTVAITKVLSDLAREGRRASLDAISAISPYVTAHIIRFGRFSLDHTRQPLPLDALARDLPFGKEEADAEEADSHQEKPKEVD